jgi:pimeloyl-ACP methyl ester carboxylesterase
MTDLFHTQQNKFTVDIYGTADKPHILFFGGWGVPASSYRDRLSLLGEHFFVYGVSLPGFGDNEPLTFEKNHIRGHAEFFGEYVLPNMELSDGLVLMGHSTGAGVATLIAEQHAGLTSKLILVSPVGSPDPLHKSLVRMIKEIDLKEALKYSTAEYWRRALPNMRLGVDAKYIDLVGTLDNLISKGLDVHIFLSQNDRIAPPGKLPEINNAKIVWVEGGHSWFKDYPDDLLTSMIDIIYPEEVTVEAKGLKSLWLAVSNYFRRLFNMSAR